MMEAAKWLSQKSVIAVVIAVFAWGGWVYTQDVRVSALEARVKQYTMTPLRLQKLETVQGYIRTDIKGVKKEVEKTNDLLRRLDTRLDNVYGRSSR